MQDNVWLAVNKVSKYLESVVEWFTHIFTRDNGDWCKELTGSLYMCFVSELVTDIVGMHKGTYILIR